MHFATKRFPTGRALMLRGDSVVDRPVLGLNRFTVGPDDLDEVHSARAPQPDVQGGAGRQAGLTCREELTANRPFANPDFDRRPERGRVAIWPLETQVEVVGSVGGQRLQTVEVQSCTLFTAGDQVQVTVVVDVDANDTRDGQLGARSEFEPARKLVELTRAQSKDDGVTVDRKDVDTAVV